MTWGKALLEWSVDHLQALRRIVDLNHRYALDGRDPASYGGILWCLGQFDRPFFPEQPVIGTVRPRPLAFHRQRTDLAAYHAHVDRPTFASMPRVAMIGCGLGGLFCSRILHDHGLDIQCFDKSQRSGGRAATRVDKSVDESMEQWDHGAQYFTLRDPRLKAYGESWLEDQRIAIWKATIVDIRQPGQWQATEPIERLVAVPRMNALGEHLANDLSIRFETQVARVEQRESVYELFDDHDDKLGDFDVVLWNCPPVQTQRLAPERCSWSARLSHVEMQPCWAVMISSTSRWDVPLDAAFINTGSLSWMARDSSKPGRSTARDRWVLHSTSDWAAKNLEMSKDAVARHLLDEASRLTGHAIPSPDSIAVHRWLYARPAKPLPESSLWDAVHSLGACGDWCGGPRVEGALLSGMSLAGRVLGSLHDRGVPSQISAHATSVATSKQLRLF